MTSPEDTPPPTSTWIPQFSSDHNMQNPNIQNPDFQPLEVNPVSNMLPEVSSGAEAITINVPPLSTSGMHQGPPTMGFYPQMPRGPSAPQEMIPPLYATEGKNDDVFTSEVKTTSEKEYQEQHKRKREIMHQDGSESDHYSKTSRSKSSMHRENKEDMAGRKEEVEISEGKRRATEELLQHQKESKNSSHQGYGRSDKTMMRYNNVESSRDAVEKKQSDESGSVIGDMVMKNSGGDLSTMLSITAASVIEQSSKPPSSSGCHGRDDDDDDENYQDLAFDGMVLSLHDKQLIAMIPNTKDEVLSYKINWDVSDQHELYKKMRPWISKKILEFLEGIADGVAECILMSMDNRVCASQMLQMLQSLFQVDDMEMFFLNLWRMLIFEIKRKEEVAGFVKCFKQERSEVERAINMLSGDSLRQRDRHCDDVESSNCARDVNEDIIRDSKSYQQYLLPLNSFGLNKVWDFEQFIDMIPKTKEGLFSYVINWDLFDKHELGRRMKPWILKKKLEFYEIHEATTVDSIVASIQNHARPSEMVDLLQGKLGDEDENFVLNMLRMLIFEIKKVETEFADCISNGIPKEERSEEARGINMRSGDVVMGDSVGDVSTMLSTIAASDIGQSSKAPLLSCFHEIGYDVANNQKKMSPRGSFDSAVEGTQKVCDGEICQDLAFDGMKLSSHEKELIDMIPNTNDEVLSYKINWDVSDQHELHKKMRPWISKKILEFLEDDADGTAERILKSMCKRCCASEMLQMLQSMFEDDVEMFSLNLWRMLIFEIKKQEEVLEIQAHIYNYKAPKKSFEVDRSINMPSGDKSKVQDQDWNDMKSNNFSRAATVDKIRDSDSYQDLEILLGTFDRKMLTEVEQFIGMIPKTKEKLFLYEINWAVSDKHELHKKMESWISKNVTEFLEEDDVLVGIIEYCIEHHIQASRVLETIQVIMKDDGELFFLKFWRMLIFEIKKVETVTAFAKRFNVDPKEERSEVERALDTRSGDSSSQQDRHCNHTESSNCTRDVNKDIIRDSKSYLHHHALLSLYDKEKRLPDFEQFIYMIPKTKEELFSYEINWDLFDKHELHERMRPWILENIIEFYEKRDASTVDSIVTSIKDHASSSKMVNLLQQKLDNHAEKFVVSMLRMLIFEIKKVETDLAERISNANPKEERSEGEREINIRSGNMLSQLDRDQKTCDSNSYLGRDILMLFDSEQLRLRKQVAEKLPKTKEELFSYKINWHFYEKYGLRWSMSRWISNQIKDLVGWQVVGQQVLVDYILSSLNDHVPASRMQERLQPILGHESEMLVWKMWRMLIFSTWIVFLP